MSPVFFEKTDKRWTTTTAIIIYSFLFLKIENLVKCILIRKKLGVLVDMVPELVEE